MKILLLAGVLSLAFTSCIFVQRASAITLQVDYTYDTSNFFGIGNPQGAAAGVQAKSTLEAAASYFSSILTDSFSAIQTPGPLFSSVSDGRIVWSWQGSFANPTTGATMSVADPPLPANRYVIYAGGSDLAGSIAGIGAVGGVGKSKDVIGTNLFTQAEINQANSTATAFFNTVDTRGQSSGFVSWGGVVSFDNTAWTWHFNNGTLPTAGETDFYSIAIHELAHALGFGEQSDPGPAEWQKHIDGTK